MTAQILQFSARSAHASRLRHRKYRLVREFGIPENLLGGSLSKTHRRCGKPNCRCVNGHKHGQWSVTHYRGGKKYVERVPEEWVEDLQDAILRTQAYLDAMKEITRINLELLCLTRTQHQKKGPKTVKKRSTFSPPMRSLNK